MLLTIPAGFNEEFFEALVGHISGESGLLLEIVNWNIEGQQYVCAGNVSSFLQMRISRWLILKSATRPTPAQQILR